MHYFLRNDDPTGGAPAHLYRRTKQCPHPARAGRNKKVYARLFEKYDGRKIADDTAEYPRKFHPDCPSGSGKSFPWPGDRDPAPRPFKPIALLIALENNVTGRHLRDGTTNLVIDLKKRQLLQEEKLNYELNLGARKFKCTTVPIIRKEYGVVGAICVNVDVNYLTDDVLASHDRVVNFFRVFCRTDMQLDENILSRDEYARALKGKRHFKDEHVSLDES